MSKHINPLFLLFSSIAILVISIYSFSNSKKQLVIQKQEFKEQQILALKYHNLNNLYSNKQNITKTINDILRVSRITNANIIYKHKLIIIQMVSLQINKVDKFINKLLNKHINIKKLELSKDKVILTVELI